MSDKPSLLFFKSVGVNGGINMRLWMNDLLAVNKACGTETNGHGGEPWPPTVSPVTCHVVLITLNQSC